MNNKFAVACMHACLLAWCFHATRDYIILMLFSENYAEDPKCLSLCHTFVDCNCCSVLGSLVLTV